MQGQSSQAGSLWLRRCVIVNDAPTRRRLAQDQREDARRCLALELQTIAAADERVVEETSVVLWGSWLKFWEFTLTLIRVIWNPTFSG